MVKTTRQYKTRQDKTRQGKTRQEDKTRQDKDKTPVFGHKTTHDTTSQHTTWQNKTRQGMSKRAPDVNPESILWVHPALLQSCSFLKRKTKGQNKEDRKQESPITPKGQKCRNHARRFWRLPHDQRHIAKSPPSTSLSPSSRLDFYTTVPVLSLIRVYCFTFCQVLSFVSKIYLLLTPKATLFIPESA